MHRLCEMMFKLLGRALLIVLPCLSTSAAIIDIADSSQGYSNFSLPAVNSGGTVAFNASTAGTAKLLFNGNDLFVGNGSGPASLVLDQATAGLSGLGEAPSINNAGQIGFVANGPGPSGPGTNIYRIDPGGAVTKIFDSQGSAYYAVWVATTQVPDTVFFRFDSYSLPRAGVGSGTGGPPNLFYPATSSHQLGRAAASASGANWAASGSNIGGPPYHFILVNGATTISQSTTYIDTDTFFNPITNLPQPTSGQLDHFGDADINSGGTLLFSANWDGGYDALFSYKDGVLTRLAKSTSNSSLLAYATPAINDNGVIAALFNGSPKSIQYGDGALTNTLITVGDPLAGSTVTDLDFEHDGLSEGNQLAFYAALADGRQGIFLASVPEPAATMFVVCGAILFWRRRWSGRRGGR